MSKKENIVKNKDHTDVILEEINSKFDLILEQFSGVRKEIRENHEEFVEFKNETSKNFKIVFEYLSKIDKEIQDMKTEILELKSRLKEKADLERLLALEKRMANVEKLLKLKLAQ